MNIKPFLISHNFGLLIDLIGHIIWPLLVLIFILVHRRRITSLLESIHRLKFADIEAEFNKREKDFAEEEVSPLSDELDGLTERVKLLEIELAKLQNKPMTSEIPNEEAIKTRIMDALKNGIKRWRSIQRLAILSGSDEEQVLEILRNENSVVLGQGKSGRRIARMKNR